MLGKADRNLPGLPPHFLHQDKKQCIAQATVSHMFDTILTSFFISDVSVCIKRLHDSIQIAMCIFYN